MLLALCVSTAAFSPPGRMTLRATAAVRAVAPVMNDPVIDAIALVPVVVTGGAMAIIFKDGTNCSPTRNIFLLTAAHDAALAQTSLLSDLATRPCAVFDINGKRKEQMPNQGRSTSREFISRDFVKSGKIQEWLDSNPGGGKTDWDRKKGIF